MEKTESTDYLLRYGFGDLSRGLKSNSDSTYNHSLPYLRCYYRLYQKIKDEQKKQEILEKMKEIISRSSKPFIMPKGVDKEVVEIFQLLGYRI